MDLFKSLSEILRLSKALDVSFKGYFFTFLPKIDFWVTLILSAFMKLHIFYQHISCNCCYVLSYQKNCLLSSKSSPVTNLSGKSF